VIDAAGEDPAGVVERLRARLAEHGIVAQHVIPGPPTGEIPVGISVRHVHLDRASCDALFGPGYELERSRDVSQPGQFAARETVDVIGPHGELHGVAIIAPLRAEAQIELARTDAIHLGITPPLRESGHLAGTPGLRLRGPRGEVALDHGAIIAQRHVHMNPADAERFGLRDRDVIQVRVRGDREMVLGDVVVRVAPDFTLDLHLDTDEANAAGLTSNQHVAFAGLERRG
jgi:propanediol utilization protein